MWTGKPRAQIRIDCSVQVSAFERCLFVREERGHPLRPHVIRETGADEHERRDPFRRVECELEPRIAAERNAHQRGSLDADFVHGLTHRSPERDRVRLERRVPETGEIDPQHQMRSRKGTKLRLPETRIREAGMEQDNRRPFAVDVVPDAHPSSANSGRMYVSKVSRSQLATVTGVSARTDAVRGTSIASATSPK